MAQASLHFAIPSPPDKQTKTEEVNRASHDEQQ